MFADRTDITAGNRACQGRAPQIPLADICHSPLDKGQQGLRRSGVIAGPALHELLCQGQGRNDVVRAEAGRCMVKHPFFRRYEERRTA